MPSSPGVTLVIFNVETGKKLTAKNSSALRSRTNSSSRDTTEFISIVSKCSPSGFSWLPKRSSCPTKLRKPPRGASSVSPPLNRIRDPPVKTKIRDSSSVFSVISGFSAGSSAGGGGVDGASSLQAEKKRAPATTGNTGRMVQTFITLISTESSRHADGTAIMRM